MERDANSPLFDSPLDGDSFSRVRLQSHRRRLFGSRMVWRCLQCSSARCDPCTGPGASSDSHHDQHDDRESCVKDEARSIRSGMLLRLAEQVGEDAATEGSDLADHATSHRGREGPAEGDELEGGSVASAQGREAEHEE